MYKCGQMASAPLTLEILQVCSSAANRPGGLDIIGITDTFRSPKIPFAVAQMAIVFRFRLPALKHVVGKLRFVMVNPDGREVWQNSGQIDQFTEATRDNFTSAVSNLVFGFQHFVFEQKGLHEIRVYWNDEEMASAPLYILDPLAPGDKPGTAEVIG